LGVQSCAEPPSHEKDEKIARVTPLMDIETGRGTVETFGVGIDIIDDESVGLFEAVEGKHG
jgi:hypothetical protein